MLGTDETGRDATMPLLLCRSTGGPYDDEAFMSGWRLGDIAATLGRADTSALAQSIRAHELLQADLIAMAYGYSMTAERGNASDWVTVTFSRLRHDD